MKILLVDRNIQELMGIRWYLQTYLAGDIKVEFSTNATDAATKMHLFQPDALLINIDLLPERQHTAIYTLLQQDTCHTFAMTAEPMFQTAIKAIDIHAESLFTKPVDLEQLKRKLTLMKKRDRTQSMNDSFYLQLFLGDHSTDSIFTLVEPENVTCIRSLYDWLQSSVLFEHIKVFPFSNWLVCLFPAEHVERDIRTLQKEWQNNSHFLLNICVFDDPPAPLNACYSATKKALEQCFYTGFGHIFYTSKKIETVSFDPLLSPEQQQAIIDSLEQFDMERFQQFLAPLQMHYYEQEDVRVHLTSVLAQVRRFMLKYKLGQNSELEQQYRQLFRFIIDQPILYTIINEIHFFTEGLLNEAKQKQILQQPNFAQLAHTIITQHYMDASLSLTKIAKKLGISSNYLSTLFAKEYRVPLKKYMQYYRIDKAAQQLTDTDFTIAEIARATGFDDPNYFSKTFKQLKGTPPKKYRAQINSEN